VTLSKRGMGVMVSTRARWRSPGSTSEKLVRWPGSTSEKLVRWPGSTSEKLERWPGSTSERLERSPGSTSEKLVRSPGSASEKRRARRKIAGTGRFREGPRLCLLLSLEVSSY